MGNDWWKALVTGLEDFNHVIVVVLDGKGRLVSGNRGFRMLLRGPGEPFTALEVSTWFQSPDGLKPVHHGLMRLECGDAGIKHIRGNVWRIPDGFLLIGEKDASDLSAPDVLTGLGNRRAWEQAIAVEIARVERYGGALSIVLGDIDDYVDLIAELGQAKSESVLKCMADVMAAATRKTDSLFRIGDELFVVLMSHTKLAAADMIADRIRLRFAEATYGAVGRAVTASFGVAEYGDGEDLASLLGRAHSALLTAEQAGQNRVMTATGIGEG